MTPIIILRFGRHLSVLPPYPLALFCLVILYALHLPYQLLTLYESLTLHPTSGNESMEGYTLQRFCTENTKVASFHSRGVLTVPYVPSGAYHGICSQATERSPISFSLRVHSFVILHLLSCLRAEN